MKKKGSNKIVITDSFQAWAHKWGRIGTLIALLYMIAIPFVVLTFYDSLPSIGEVINLSTISILMIYIPVGFSEAISYTPILGASSYLTFITGNIMNLKLPCAVNAMKLAKKLAIHMTDVLKCDGFNLVQNNHEVAGQTVFHFHMHLIPRYLNAKNNDILNWSHETFSPEEMAEIRDSLKMES